MAVKVIIRRRFPREKEKELFKCIREIRSLVPLQPGYITSEYLKTIEEKNEITTISSWFSLEDWQAWFDSDLRKAVQAKIDRIEGIESDYAIYRYIITR